MSKLTRITIIPMETYSRPRGETTTEESKTGCNRVAQAECKTGSEKDTRKQRKAETGVGETDNTHADIKKASQKHKDREIVRQRDGETEEDKHTEKATGD